jgi:DNA-binding Lrp family transcriptional regulator
MDKLDSKVLRELQNSFPLSEKPYEIIAQRLQITFDQFWIRLQRLIDEGLIRRIGASLDSRKLGFSSTLAAVNVKADLIERASEIISQFPEVTHSYLRSGNFNIWFTIIAFDNKRIKNILEQIRSNLSLEDSQVLNLPVKRLFKLNARFSVPPKT